MEMLNMKNQYLTDLLPEIVKNYLNAECVSINFVGGGSNGKVFRVKLSDNRTIAVKAFRQQGSQAEEAKQLNLLEKNTFVRMPEVLFIHADDKSALMGMSFIEGENVLNPLFLLKSKAKKDAFAKEVVSGMMEWHKVKGNKYGDLNEPKYDRWCEYYITEKQQPWLKALGELCEKGKFSKKKYDLLCRATDIFNEVCQEPESPVLIHGDLNIMNIMADTKSLKLNGFIDPCGSMWADKEYDLFQLQNMWGNCFGLYETYKSLNKTSEHTDFRVAYYGAMNEASCRLGSGLIMPVWEDLWNIRLKKSMKRY